MAKHIKKRNEARRWPRPPYGTRADWHARERRLLILGYKAQAIGYRKAHLGDSWLQHFIRKADHLLALAAKEWNRVD